MDALAELCAERGYGSTKISDIVSRAGVARRTLYDNFEGKEAVFLSAFDVARDEAIRRVEEGCAATGSEGWQERARAGLDAFLGYVAEQPILAHMCMVDALTATPAATERYEGAIASFVQLLRQSLPEVKGSPRNAHETVVGGVSRVVYRQIRNQQAQEARTLLPALSEFVIRPYREADLAGVS